MKKFLIGVGSCVVAIVFITVPMLVACSYMLEWHGMARFWLTLLCSMELVLIINVLIEKYGKDAE